MKRKLLRILILCTFLLAFTCYTDEDIENRISIKNNRDFDIYCLPSFAYPDTSLAFTSKNSIDANTYAYSIDKNSSKRLGYLSLCYKDEFNRVVESDTLILFIFNKDTIDLNSWEYITNNDKVLKRIYLTYPDLIESNCEIEIN